MIYKFSYESSNQKDLVEILKLHIEQRMTDIWQEKENKKAAIAILKCLCNGKIYKQKIQELITSKPELLFTFMEACKQENTNDGPYVKSTVELENALTLVLKTVALNCDVNAYYENDTEKIQKNLEEQIALLENFQVIKDQKDNNKNRQNDFGQSKTSAFYYPYAEEYRMNAMIVRMRKSLKRGSNRQIAILLLQLISQMNGMNLKSTIQNIRQNEQQYIELKKFVFSVNKDYHRINIALSIKNMDLRVQVNEEKLDLSNVNNHKKQALNKTLERYAASKEDSDDVLLQLKSLLFEYFCIENTKLLTTEQLWKFPNGITYFDDEFVPYNVSEQSEDEKTLEMLWEDIEKSNKRKDRAIKKRIQYVNYGKYLSLIKDEQDTFRKYWCSFIKEYIEQEYVEKKNFF